MKLLDTDASVEAIRGTARVVRRLDAETESVATTVITAAELHFGAAKSRDPELGHSLVDRFLTVVPPVTLTTGAARSFGQMKALLERRGQRLEDADLLIAAICLTRRATLVTGNLRHFDRIPGLTIENWLRPGA